MVGKINKFDSNWQKQKLTGEVVVVVEVHLQAKFRPGVVGGN